MNLYRESHINKKLANFLSKVPPLPLRKFFFFGGGEGGGNDQTFPPWMKRGINIWFRGREAACFMGTELPF